jgi:NTP pyrophosphatase (non-canonical NTP hydrolase)
MKALIEKIINFRDLRDWQKYHTPANLAKSITIEASELLENFQWLENEFDLQLVADELADVFIYALTLAHDLKLDVPKIINHKLRQNEAKYPIEKVKGSAKKYTQYK